MTNNRRTDLVKPGERLDDLQVGGLELIQNPEGFCFGVDAVFLSDFVKVKSGETVLDLGTGNGIIPILLSAKTSGKSLPDSRFKKRRQIWLDGVWHTIIWKAGSIL